MMNSSHDENAVSAEALMVRRGKREILHGLEFTLPRGSITGLLGPSGCGKTTLMRAMVGVQHIHDGTLTILGLPAGHPELRRRVGYTSQAVSIYTDITVRENVAYFARLQGVGAKAVDAAIDRVELGGQARQRVDQLSGGQASRASLACALVAEPALLVLDEPTVGLDPLTRESLWSTFHALVADGATMLVSSHVMDEAQRCDSVLFMREGRFLAHDPVGEVQQRTGTATAEEAFLALIKDAA